MFPRIGLDFFFCLNSAYKLATVFPDLFPKVYWRKMQYGFQYGKSRRKRGMFFVCLFCFVLFFSSSEGKHGPCNLGGCWSGFTASGLEFPMAVQLPTTTPSRITLAGGLTSMLFWNFRNGYFWILTNQKGFAIFLPLHSSLYPSSPALLSLPSVLADCMRKALESKKFPQHCLDIIVQTKERCW